MTTGDSDLDLLERWQGGEARAGQLLVSKYFDQIRKFFINAVSDDEREDLIQDTFRRLVQSVAKFEGRSSFRTFLFRIAHNTLIDHLRRRYRGKGDFDPIEHSVVDLDGVSPSRLINELERHQQLLACVRALPVETKQLLELYYWQDFTAAELAQLLEVPERTLRSRLGAARKRLRACMELEPGAPGDRASEGDDPALEGQLRELGEFFESGRVRSQ